MIAGQNDAIAANDKPDRGILESLPEIHIHRNRLQPGFQADKPAAHLSVRYL
jgi:hypothetical protein